MTENDPSPKKEFQVKIDELKDPTAYTEKYETKEVRELTRAVEILWALALEANTVDATKVGVDKLLHAKRYLDGLLREQFEDQERKS